MKTRIRGIIISVGCVGLIFLCSYHIHLIGQEKTERQSQGPCTTTYCPICETVPIDGVVLVDTQTGDTKYLEVWLPHETYVGQAAPWEDQQQQSDGYFNFSRFGDGTGYGDSSARGEYTFHFKPENLEERAYLCDYHAAIVDTTYILVDSMEEPQAVFAVKKGREYKIRLNDVSVSFDRDNFIISIVSHLYDKEMGTMALSPKGR